MTQPGFADPADAARYAQYREQQIEEYGTWVAAYDIRVGGVMAFPAGFPVPASTVAVQGWDKTGEVKPVQAADRAAQLKARQEQLQREQDAITAELAAADAGSPYEGLKVDELRAELADRGLPVSGTKDELLARLNQNDEKGE